MVRLEIRVGKVLSALMLWLAVGRMAGVMMVGVTKGCTELRPTVSNWVTIRCQGCKSMKNVFTDSRSV